MSETTKTEPQKHALSDYLSMSHSITSADLRKMMEKLQFSQAALASLFFVTPTTVSRWLSNKDGKTPIPPYVALCLHLIMRTQSLDGEVRVLFHTNKMLGEHMDQAEAKHRKMREAIQKILIDSLV